MANGYWNAHSDLDWLAQCGIEDGLPCEMCESSTGNFCLVCGFEEGEACPYETPAVEKLDDYTPLELLEVHARCWDRIMDTLFGEKK